MKLKTDHISSLVLIAGISGAGNSTALNTFADLGFYAIDNLPLPLFPELLTFSGDAPKKFERTALLLDIDSSSELAHLLAILQALPPANLRLAFIDCSTEILLRRYSETRRPHPAFDPTQDKTIEDAIERERQLLMPFKEAAHIVFGTTELNVHEFRRELKSFVDSLKTAPEKLVRINFISFGFKFGMPRDLDLLIDVRFLPNPHFVTGMRDKTGVDKDVYDYVLNSPDASAFIEKYGELLKFLLPRYVFEGKSYLNVGVGCTGGKHRSVAIAERLHQTIDQKQYMVSVKHRDIFRK